MFRYLNCCRGVLQHATEDRSLIVGLAFIITPVLELLKSLARRCWFAKLSYAQEGFS